MPQDCALHLSIKVAHTGPSRELFCSGGVKLNLLEFTWAVSCSIATNHYGGRRATMAIEYCFNVVYILSYPVSTIGRTMVGF